MRKTLILLATFVLALPAPALRSAPASSPATARVIVKFKSDSPLLRPRAAAAQRGAEPARALGERLGIALAGGPALAERALVVQARGLDSAALAARLAREADVEYAVPDQRRRRVTAPNDPLYLQGPPLATTSGGPAVGQWYLRAPTAELKSSLDVEPAWTRVAGAGSVVVAVLDTGVRFDHVDLQRAATGGRLLDGYDFVSDIPTANDGDGRDADASDPGDWITQAENDLAGGPFEGCGVEDSSWHGTQVGSVVGALTNNGLGMAGVLGAVPGARVLPVRVLGKCGGWDSDIIAGMRWAAGLAVPGVPANAHPARVINLSLGSEGSCTAAYLDATAELAAAGATVVASAGNSAGRAVATPANCTGVIAVAGLRHAGTKVGFSDLGPEIALSAPGGNCVHVGPGEPCLYPILSASNAGTTAPLAGSSIYTDSFKPSLGTSFAAPLVAGSAALMLAAQPTLSAAEVRALLKASARPFPSGGDAGVALCRAPDGTDQLECVCTADTCGAGMLDAGAAVAAALAMQARIDVAPAQPQAGQEVTLSGAGSVPLAGRSLTAYQWTLLDGGGIVSAFATPGDGVSTRFTASGAGRVSVALTVTDNRGARATATLALDIAAAPPVPPAPPPAAPVGGGGALGLGWLLALGAAVVAVRRARHAGAAP